MTLLVAVATLLVAQQDPWMADGAAARKKALKEQRPCILILDADNNNG